MRKKLSFLSFSVALLLFACGGGDDGAPSGGNEYLNVSDLSLSGSQTTAPLNIQASPNCEWTIAWSDSWIRSITPARGRGSQEVTITIDINPSLTTNRTAVLTISNSNGSITRTVRLQQLASIERLTISGAIDGKLTFPSNSTGKEYKITVSSNTHWTVQGIPSWLNVSPLEGNNDGELTITATPNQTREARNATLVIRGDGGTSANLTVTQNAAPLPVVTKPSVTSIGKNEAWVSFTFTSEAIVTAYGICYDTKENPTIQSSLYEPKTGSATQMETSIQISNLNSGTKYYVRAYATSAVGTQYSEQETFTTVSNWPENGDNTTPNN